MNNQFIQRVIFDWNRIDNDSYLKGIEAFKGIEKLDFNKPITFFVGENGSGKSTLLEALAVAHGFNPEGGTKNYVFSTHDTHSELCDAIRIAKGYRKEKWGYFLRAESFYNVATCIITTETAYIVNANIQMCKRGSTVYYSYAFADFVRNTRCRYLLF